MSDGKVEIDILLDDSGIPKQIKKVDRALSDIGKDLPNNFSKSAKGVENRTLKMRNEVRNVLSKSERDAALSGVKFGNNLSVPIGKTSENLIKQYQATGSAISKPLVTASYIGSTAQQNLLSETGKTSNKIVEYTKKTASSFTNSMTGMFDKFGGAIGRGANKFNASLNSIGPTVIDVGNKIEGSIKRGIEAPFRGAINVVKQYGALIGVMGTGAAINSGINRLSAIEDARTSLKVMMGDIEQADAFMNDVLDFAKTTPFSFPQLATVSKNLIAFGMDAEKVVPVMKSIGDAAAASGKGAQGVDEISAAFGDLQLSSKVSLDQINRLTGNGVNALVMLANHYGISVDEMRKKISTGAVDSAEAIDVLVDGIQNGTKGVAGETAKMGGLMEELKDSWTGSVDSMKSAISSTMATILEPAMPYMRKSMEIFAEYFKKLPGIVFAVVDYLKPIVAELKPIFMQVVDVVKNQVIPAIMNLLPVFEPVIKGLVAGLKMVGNFIINTIGPAFEKFGEFARNNEVALQTIVVALTAVAGTFVVLSKVIPLIMGIKKVFKAFKTGGTVIKGVSAAMKAMNLTFLANPIVLAIVAIVAALAAAAFLIYKYWDEIKEVWSKTASWFKETWGKVADWFSKVWEKTKEVFINLWNSLVDFVKEWGIVIIGALTGPIGLAVSLIIKFWEPIKEFFVNTWNHIKDKSTEIWNNIVDYVVGIKDKIVETWDSFKEMITNKFNETKDSIMNVWDSIVEVITTAFNAIMERLSPFIEFFSDMFSIIYETGVNIFNNLSAFISSVWDSIKNIAVNAWNIIKNAVLGLILVFVNLITGNFEEVRNSITQIWDNIKNSLQSIWESIVDIAFTVWEFIKGNILAVVEGIKAGIGTAFNFIKDIITNVINNVQEFLSTTWENIKLTIDTVLNAIHEKFDNIMNGIYDIMVNVWSFIDNLWRAALEFILGDSINKFESIKHAIEDAMAAVWEIIESVWQFISDTFNNAIGFIMALVRMDFGAMHQFILQQMESVSNFINRIWSAIKTFFSSTIEAIKLIIKQKFQDAKNTIINIWSSIRNWLSETVTNIWNTIKRVFENIRTAISNSINGAGNIIRSIWDGIKTFFTQTLASIYNGIITRFNNMVSGIREKMTSVKTTIQTLWNQAKQFLLNINLREIGRNIIQGLINGITSKISAVTKAVKDVTDKITGKIKGILGIHSPSWYFRDMIGKNMMMGLKIGVEREENTLVRTASAVTEWVTPNMRDFLSNIQGMAAPLTMPFVESAFGDITFDGPKVSNQQDNEKTYVIEVVTNLNGKEVAREIVDDVTDIQNKKSYSNYKSKRREVFK